MHRGVAAAHANRQQLHNFFRHRQQARHRFERPAHEVSVQASDYHALPHVREFHAALDHRFAQELRFVNAHHFSARRDFRQNIRAILHQFGIELQAGVRDDAVLGITLVNHRLENLHTLFRNFRAAQPANQLLALAGKHWPNDYFDPTHVALDDVHASSPLGVRLTHTIAEIQAPCSRLLDAYSSRLKNGAKALITAARKESCRVLKLRVRMPQAPSASRILCPPAKASIARESSTPSSTTVSASVSGTCTAPDCPNEPRPEPSVTYAQLSRNTQRLPASLTTSSSGITSRLGITSSPAITSKPPSRPTKYFHRSFCARAIFIRASARWRAPAIKSSRESGVWRTPLATSTPTISKDGRNSETVRISASASRTAFTFGRRVLPTATRIFSMRREFYQSFHTWFCFSRAKRAVRKSFNSSTERNTWSEQASIHPLISRDGSVVTRYTGIPLRCAMVNSAEVPPLFASASQ